MPLYDVPLYSQSWNLDEWKELGFTSRIEAGYWMKSCCGVLCVQGIAAFLTGQNYVTANLIQRGQNLGGYSDKHGWSHTGLAELVKALGLEAQQKELTADAIKHTLDQRKLPIISIKWAFEPKKSLKEHILFWKKYGGHLAVVVGYDAQGFYINHTSIRPKYNWKAHLLPFDQFNSGYTGRAVVVWKQ